MNKPHPNAIAVTWGNVQDAFTCPELVAYKVPFPLALEGGCVLHCSSFVVGDGQGEMQRGTLVRCAAVALAEVSAVEATKRRIFVANPLPAPRPPPLAERRYVPPSIDTVSAWIDVTHLIMRFGQLYIAHPYADVEPVFRRYLVTKEAR